MVLTTSVCANLRRTLTEITVEPVLFLYMHAVFAQYALFQDLVYSKVCWENFENDICEKLHVPEHSKQMDVVQESASHWILLATLSTGIPSLFMAIYLGSWSDRFGRKWPVAVPPLGGILGCVVYMIISFVPTAPVALICLASLLAGITGGFVSCIMSCMTYVSAVTTDENRTTRISRLEAMIYLGGTLGPFISGSLLQYIGHGYAFALMLGCYAAALFYTIVFVKDVKSNPVPAAITCEAPPDRVSEKSARNTSDFQNDEDDRREYFHQRDKHSPSPTKSVQTDNEDETNQFLGERTPLKAQGENNTACCAKYFSSEHFVSAVLTCCKKREGNRRFIILTVISAGFISMMITSGELDVAYLFTKDMPLVWTYRTYAYYLGYKFGLGAFALLLVMPLFQRMHFSDITMCIIGLISRIAGLICFGFSTSTLIAFCAPVVSIFSFFTIPSIRALLSKLVLPSEQGKMFAFIAIAEDLCSLTASMLFNSVYPLTRPFFRGFIFQMAASILIIPLLILWYVKKKLTPDILSPLAASPTPSATTTLEGSDTSVSNQNILNQVDERTQQNMT